MENNDTFLPTDTPQQTRNKYADHMSGGKKKGPSRRTWIILGVIGVVLLGLLITWLVRRGGQQDTTQVGSTAFVTRGMLQTTVEGEGVTAAKTRVTLGKDIKGTVSQIDKSVGDAVQAGDTIMIIDPVTTRKELSDAQEELYDAQRSVGDAQTEVSNARTAVTTAQNRLNDLNVTAPFSGKIIPANDDSGSEIDFRIGQQLGSGTVIGRMVDDSSMRLSLYFNTAYVDSIQAGQSATLSIPSAMGSVSGKVEKIERVEKISAEGVKLFRVVLVAANPGSLTKGMKATASISVNGEQIYPADAGTLEYLREEDIVTKVDGEITNVNGTAYYQYNAGQTILSMSNDTLKNDVDSARNTVTSAESRVEAAQKLVQSKQERIAELQKLIDEATIVSPIDGVVVSLNVNVGEEIGGTDGVCAVADLSNIVVNANIPSTDVANVQSGQSATIMIYEGDTQKSYTGTVISVSLEADKDQANGAGSMPVFPAVIALDPLDGETLRPDSNAQFSITTAQEDDCLTVPSSAIVNIESGTAVFARRTSDFPFADALPIPEGADGSIPSDFVLVPVEIGIADASNTQILSGIEEGAEVYLAGPIDAYADMMGEGGGDIAIAVG